MCECSEARVYDILKKMRESQNEDQNERETQDETGRQELDFGKSRILDFILRTMRGH